MLINFNRIFNSNFFFILFSSTKSNNINSDLMIIVLFFHTQSVPFFENLCMDDYIKTKQEEDDNKNKVVYIL
jgi:hypothetical protein